MAMPRPVMVLHAGLSEVSHKAFPRFPVEVYTNHQGMPSGHASAVRAASYHAIKNSTQSGLFGIMRIS